MPANSLTMPAHQALQRPPKQGSPGVCLQALTPFTIGRSTVKASLLGALWGFGHSTGQLILGIAMVVLKVKSGLVCLFVSGRADSSVVPPGSALVVCPAATA